jgi:cell division protein FtsN
VQRDTAQKPRPPAPVVPRDTAPTPKPVVVAPRDTVATPKPVVMTVPRDTTPKPEPVMVRRDTTPKAAPVVVRRDTTPKPVVVRRDTTPKPAPVVARRDTTPRPTVPVMRRDTTPPARATPKPMVARADTTHPPVANAAGRFGVQFAAYNDKPGAEQYAEILRSRGIAARVEGTAAPFRVRAGRFTTRAEAEAAMAVWKKPGTAAFVVPLGPTP